MKKLWIILLLTPTLAMASLVSGNKELESKAAAVDDESEKLVYVTEDVPLDPEVEAFLNTPVEEVWQDNAYIYLWGINYESKDVYQTGTEVANLVKQADTSFDYTNPYDESFFDQFSEVQRPENDVLCALNEPGCVAKTIELVSNLEEIMAQYPHMLMRYWQFFAFEHFSLVGGTTVESPIPSFRILIQAQHLLHLSLMKQLIDGNVKQATQSIEKETQLIKLRLRQADTLIGKMVMAAMLNHQLDWINWVHQKQWIQASELLKLNILKPLTAEEKSIYSAMQNEELMLVRMILDTTDIQLKELQENPPEHWVMSFFPNVGKAMIKPNLLVNVQYHRQVKPGLAYLLQDTRSFYAGLAELDLSVEHNLQVNSFGRFFNYSDEESKERIFAYQTRLFDTDMKIQLLSGIITTGSAKRLLEKLSVQPTGYLNSYDLSLPFIKDEQICYSGLYETNKKNRCFALFNP